MNTVPKRILISSGVAVALLLALNLWLWPNQALQQSATSFGVMRNGYKAAFDLLSEMHLPVTRSYRRAKQMPANQTVWFVSPSFLIADKPNAHDDAHEVVEWASRGGTAVIFGEDGSNWEVLGLTREAQKDEKKDEGRSLVQGSLGAPRWLDVPELLHFTPSKEKGATSPRVALTVDGKPFALDLAVGKKGGHIIAIADDTFLRNEHLGDADASLLVVDLARAFGTPVFDEHSHGLAAPSSLTFAVLDSRAILPIGIGLLAAMLWVFSKRTWPRRSLDDDSDLPAPSIAGFVDSLSILYSRAGDPASVFRAYRGGFLRRLRRQLGLRADYPEDLLLERLARDRSLPDATRHWLLASDIPADQPHLVIAVRALESYPGLGHEDRT
jgi:hypothetical protein